MPSDSQRHVAIAFADHSLGGVSRSALSAGKMWSELGFSVSFVPHVPVHPDRREKFAEVGALLSSPSEVDWDSVNLVHLHHGAVNSRTRSQVGRLVAAVGARTIPLVTKNVFAVNDHILNQWSGPRCTTVPGRWTSLQYNYNVGKLSTKDRPGIIPNVQDGEFFRPPTVGERIDARSALGVTDDRRVILRVGSPIRGKWSSSYVRLADEAATVGAKLVLLGAPPSLRAEIEQRTDSVSFLDPTSDDRAIRRLYWAADVFALDAARGETFGNVAFESLLSGTPVAYRAREWRDNTLWEVADLPEFAYRISSAEWVKACVSDTSWQTRTSDATRAELVSKYARAAVLEIYASIFESVRSARSGNVAIPDTTWAKDINLRKRVKVLANHNQLVTVLKAFKLWLRERRG